MATVLATAARVPVSSVLLATNTSQQGLFPPAATPVTPAVTRGSFVIGYVIYGQRSNGVTSGAAIATALQQAAAGIVLGNLMMANVRQRAARAACEELCMSLPAGRARPSLSAPPRSS